MKKTLLFTILIASQLMSAQYYISELVVSPPNNSGVFNDYTDTPLVRDFEYAPDDTLEYFEFRGTPGETIPADIYFISVDGDDENPGRIQDAVELSGLTFGSNGILVIVSNLTFDTGSLDSDGTTDISGVKITNPYATDLAASGATVETLEFTGIPAWVLESDGDYELDRVNGVSSIRGYDGTIIDQSATYMIVRTTAGEGNPDGEEIDANADGILDGLAENWTIYDGVSILDDDDDVEFAYSSMIFIEEPDGQLPLSVTLTYDPALSPSIIPLNQYPQYVARQGLKTGNSATVDGVNNDDWMAGRINSRSYPDWNFNGTAARNFPSAEVTGNTLSEFNGFTPGKANVDFDTTASVDEVFSSKVSIYPNPANQYINIVSNVDINKVDVYNLLGKRVLSSSNLKNNLDVSSLSKGMYMLKLTSGSSIASKKLIIK